jgi:hypothetical protein
MHSDAIVTKLQDFCADARGSRQFRGPHMYDALWVKPIFRILIFTAIFCRAYIVLTEDSIKAPCNDTWKHLANNYGRVVIFGSRRSTDRMSMPIASVIPSTLMSSIRTVN